jgi:hypothetical protein
MSLVIWYNFKNSPFSLGLKGQYYNFRMPFDAYLDQTLTILGQEIATAKTRGEGDLELSSFAASILGRWIFLKEKKFQLSVFGGLNFFPYEGSTFLDAQIEIDSPLGDVFFQQSDSLTLDEMREWDDSIPSLLVSPELGLSFQYRFSPKLGVVIDVAIYQGAFISPGMFFDQ